MEGGKAAPKKWIRGSRCTHNWELMHIYIECYTEAALLIALYHKFPRMEEKSFVKKSRLFYFVGFFFKL